MTFRLGLCGVVVAVVLAVAVRPAEARHARFLGPHPIAARLGGGFCYIEAPHLHVYLPDHVALYQQVGGAYVFTGDPTPFGYEGERHVFYGHHPVLAVDAEEPVYCYLDGPHYHAYAPEGVDFKVKGGVAFYVGAYPPEYVKVKGHRARLVNAEYRPFVTVRPVVQVAPPPEWRGEVVVGPPRVEVEVRAPGVMVVPPPPVLVAPPAPHVFIAPAPRVLIAPPGPGVVVGAPGPVFVEPRGRRHHHDDDDDQGEWREHDRGKHKGWYKHHERED